jgi:hypothetical protein
MANKLPSSSINASTTRNVLSGKSLNDQVLENCMVAPFKTKMLDPGELERPF